MDETGVRAALQHYLDYSAAGEEDVAHEIYVDDAVLEFPQSGERFEGVANFREWRRQYPATKVEFDVRRVRGGGDVVGRGAPDPLRRRAVELRRRDPRVPRRQGGPRDDLRHGRLGGAGVALGVVGRAAEPDHRREVGTPSSRE